MEIAAAGGRRATVAASPKWKRSAEPARKALANITNTGRVAGGGGEVRSPMGKALPGSKGFIDLVKENSTLLKLLEERNKVIEESSSELQKLRLDLQKTCLQNSELAQANCQMLMELNSGKDRLKELQHALGCTTSVLKAKTLELEEKEKVIRLLSERVGPVKEQQQKCAEVLVDASRQADNKKLYKGNKKRTSETQSLAVTTTGGETKPKRHSLRSFSKLELSLFQPETAERESKIEDADNNVHAATSAPLKKEAMNNSRRKSMTPGSKLSLQEVSSVPVEFSIDEEKRLSGLSESDEEKPTRSSIARPLRRAAAEKITSYKELPLNVKMRR